MQTIVVILKGAVAAAPARQRPSLEPAAESAERACAALLFGFGCFACCGCGCGGGFELALLMTLIAFAVAFFADFCNRRTSSKTVRTFASTDLRKCSFRVPLCPSSLICAGVKLPPAPAPAPAVGAGAVTSTNVSLSASEVKGQVCNSAAAAASSVAAFWVRAAAIAVASAAGSDGGWEGAWAAVGAAAADAAADAAPPPLPAAAAASSRRIMVRASINAHPSTFVPFHLAGWRARGSSSFTPVPQILSPAVHSAINLVPVASNLRNAMQCKVMA